MGPADGRQVLLLAITRVRGGRTRYTYSIYPGVTAWMLVDRGVILPAPDDPAIVAEVIRLEDSYARARKPDTGDSETS